MGLAIERKSKAKNRSYGLVFAYMLSFSMVGITSALAVGDVAAPSPSDNFSDTSASEPDLDGQLPTKQTSSTNLDTSTAPVTPVSPAVAESSPKYRYEAFSNDGARGIKVFDNLGWLATFTNNSRSVVIRGSIRTFSEPSSTSATVRHNQWVRLSSATFKGTVEVDELERLSSDKSPDILQTALEYTSGSIKRSDAAGLNYAGDASYGPMKNDGTREEGSDFNDFLGISWNYGAQNDEPEVNQIGSLDCSGFVRMVWGYRAGYPMRLEYSSQLESLPRRAVQMHSSVSGAKISGSSSLLPGDLLFSDASTDDGIAIDHVSIYLGIDNQGNARFISSRKTADGPTMGDIGGRSVINGTGLYARTYRGALRL